MCNSCNTCLIKMWQLTQNYKRKRRKEKKEHFKGNTLLFITTFNIPFLFFVRLTSLCLCNRWMKLERFSVHIPSSWLSCSVFRCPLCARPAGGAVSAELQLHCHVQPPVWALLPAWILLTALNHINRLREKHVHSTKVVHSRCGHVERFMARTRERKLFMKGESSEQLLHSLTYTICGSSVI